MHDIAGCVSRFPVMLCPLAGENGGDGEVGGTAQPLVQITIVQQAGGPRGQVYYPFISFRVAKTLQVSRIIRLVRDLQVMLSCMHCSACWALGCPFCQGCFQIDIMRCTMPQLTSWT